MPSPIKFPGMNPYLESYLWPDFHAKFALECVRELNKILPKDLVAAVEINLLEVDPLPWVRSKIVPDAYIKESNQGGLLEEPMVPYGTSGTTVTEELQLEQIPQNKQYTVRIYRLERGGVGEIIAAIEVLSPTNKKPGDGLNAYRKKRENYLRAGIHLLEIDLLRAGARPFAKESWSRYTYSVQLINALTYVLQFWGFDLSDPLPEINLPLRLSDPPVGFRLQKIIEEVYAMSRYDGEIDYGTEVPGPELREKDQRAFEQLKAQA